MYYRCCACSLVLFCSAIYTLLFHCGTMSTIRSIVLSAQEITYIPLQGGMTNTMRCCGHLCQCYVNAEKTVASLALKSQAHRTWFLGWSLKEEVGCHSWRKYLEKLYIAGEKYFKVSCPFRKGLVPRQAGWRSHYSDVTGATGLRTKRLCSSLTPFLLEMGKTVFSFLVWLPAKLLLLL